jgi:hypothetical protein
VKAQSLRRTLWLAVGALGVGLAGVLGWFFVKVRPALAQPVATVRAWSDESLRKYQAEPISPQPFYAVVEKDLEAITRPDLPTIGGRKVGVFVGPVPPPPEPEKPAVPVDTGPKGLAELGRPIAVIYSPPRTSFTFEFSKDKRKEPFAIGEQIPRGGKFTVVDVRLAESGSTTKYRFVYEWTEKEGEPPRREEILFDLSPKTTGAVIEQLGGRPAPAEPAAGGTPPPGPGPGPAASSGAPPPVSAVRLAVTKPSPNQVAVVFDNREAYDYFVKNDAESILSTIKTDTARDAEGKPRGIKITGIDPGSIAHEFEIKQGDILVSVNNQPVHDRNDVVRIVKALPKDVASVRVVIERNARQIVYDVDPRDPDIRRGAGRLRFGN